jgi:hypothetical protein
VRTLAYGDIGGGVRRVAISFEVLERSLRFRIAGHGAERPSIGLPAWLQSGMAGVGAWFRNSADHPLTFESLWLEPRLAQAVLVHRVEEARAAVELGAVDILAPTWYEVASLRGGRVQVIGQPQAVLGALAERYGASIWPVLPVVELPPELSAAGLDSEVDRLVKDAGASGVLVDPRPARAAGNPLSPAQWRALLDVLRIPLAAIPDVALEEFVSACPIERLVWVAVAPGESQLGTVPPEKLLILDSP